MHACTCWRKIQKDAKAFQTKVEPNFLRGTCFTCWNCLTHGGIILDTITHARLKCLSHAHLYTLIIELFVEVEISLTSKIRWNHDKQDLMRYAPSNCHILTFRGKKWHILAVGKTTYFGRKTDGPKKSFYTLQADPDKSREFIFKNPVILTNGKSRDPGIPGIPLGHG